MISRRDMLKWGAAAGSGLLLPFGYRQALAIATALDKNGRFLGYEPFTQELFIPKALKPTRLSPGPGEVAHGIAPEFGRGPADWNSVSRRTHEHEYELAIERSTHKFVPDGPEVPIFSYRDATSSDPGTTPGPSILADYRVPVVLRTTNRLLRDPKLNEHDNETSLHLHGSHGTAHGDGFPDFYCLAGNSRDYFYPNIAPRQTGANGFAPVQEGPFDETWIPTTLWYHDHAMDITGFNVTRGLAGFYLVRDERQVALADMKLIPEVGGPYDIGLALQDQKFNADGTQLAYDFFDHNGRLGDVFTVNGLVQPKLKVQARKYRFRFLNASNARVYEIRLSTRRKMSIIGTDSWLLPRAIEVESFQLSQGQRHDVIIDFRNGPSEVFVENIMVQTDGRGAKGVDPTKERDLLLKFEVSGPDVSETMDPRCPEGTVIRGFVGVDSPELNGQLPGQFSFVDQKEVVATRNFRFERSLGAWTINSRLFNPRRADATPVLGKGAERWIFENGGGGWWHPIHTHLEGFQIKSVNGKPPRRERQFNSDLVTLEGGFTAEVLIKFRTFTGPYVFHCHAIEHEDMRMMAVIDPTPAPDRVGEALATHPPLDGETRIPREISGVAEDCTALEQGDRILFDAVGDTKTPADRGVGFPNCKFDMSLRGNG